MTVAGGRVVLYLDGCVSISQPDHPLLPVFPAVFVLPPGERVDAVIVRALDEQPLTLPAPPALMPAQRSFEGPWRFENDLDRRVMFSSGAWPASSGELVTEQTSGGVRFAFVNLYPCRISGRETEILFAPAIEVTLITRPDGFLSAPLSPLSPSRSLALARRLAVNADDIDAWNGAAFPQPEEYVSPSPYPYVIVTAPELAAAFEPLAALKEQFGLRARIVTTDSIHANHAGDDAQERIRAFITWAWLNWRTEYVLLGGDTQLIPHRGMYVKAGSVIETDIPCDLYYSCLDGNWNTDGDQYFGEPGEEDLLPELSLGRLPVTTAQQVGDYINKLALYSLSPGPDACASALMLGEHLWSIDGVDTWGGDYKDEIRSGTSEFGFTTAGPPASFDVATLYDRDRGSWGKAQLVPALNAGVNFVNHLGHSNLHMVMRLGLGDLSLLDNAGPGGMPFVCYSQGCYAAAFDNRDHSGTYHAQDAIGEQLVTGPHGAVAFIGNTRLGWNAPGTTCGVSQFFDRRFFDAVFGRGIGRIGPALDDSRIRTIPLIDFAAVRYVMYNLALLGDPALCLWTAEPKPLAVTHNSTLSSGGGMLEVRVECAGEPLAGARVSLMSGDARIYFTESTGPDGLARLFVELADVAEMKLVAHSCGYHAYSALLPVVICDDEAPRIAYIGIDDGGQGAGSGNGNGIAESGETLELIVVVANPGAAAIEQAALVISSGDEYLRIVVDSCALGDLEPRSTLISQGGLVIEIDGATPDGHLAWFDAAIVAGDQRWTSRRSMSINAPGIVLASFAVTDTSAGNGNGCIEAWEFIDLHCAWTNTGSVDIPSPVLRLSCSQGGWARVVRGSAELSDLTGGATVASEGQLMLFIRETTPPFTPVEFVLSLETSGLVVHAETLSVTTCGYRLEDSPDASRLTHAALAGYDGWHVTDEDYHSPPSAWKCGGAPGGVYPNMMDAVLVTPPVCLEGNSLLTFRHRMEAEATSVSPYWAQDAGVVELSADYGATWRIITPVIPYPCRAATTNTIFLAPYERCFSGVIPWREETFDLSAWSGPVMLRFRFASNEQYGFEGWYIDDISITTETFTGIDDYTPRADRVTRLLSPWPNPFNPTVTIPFETAGRGPVEVQIFDVSGRLLRTLSGGDLQAGRHELVWDGRDARGRTVASGVYFCRLRAGIHTEARRIVLLR